MHSENCGVFLGPAPLQPRAVREDKRENEPIARGKYEENNCKYSPIKLLGAFVIAFIFAEWLVYLYGTINVLVSEGTATPARYIDIVHIAS